jgi:hypothetical protein
MENNGFIFKELHYCDVSLTNAQLAVLITRKQQTLRAKEKRSDSA